MSCLSVGLSQTAGAAKAAEIPEKIPVESFAQLPQAQMMKLAPDGKALAYMGVREGRNMLVVHDLLAGRSYQMATPERADIWWYYWINDKYLIVSYSFTSRRGGTNSNERRLFAVSRTLDWSKNLFRPHINAFIEGKKKDLGNEIQMQDRVIDMLPGDPDHFLMAINADRDWERKSEVRKVAVSTGGFETITEGEVAIRYWTTDRAHALRYGWGHRSSTEEIRAIYRNPENGKWTEVQDKSWYRKGARVLAFSDNPRHAYMRYPGEGGRAEIILFDMLSETKIETVFTHDKYDAGNLIYRPNGMENTGEPIGFTYSGENGAVFSYFDQEFSDIQGMLDQALPGGRNNITSALSNGGLYVAHHSSDTDAGRYFLLDMTAGQLTPLFRRMPGLDPAEMAPMSAISYTARDGVKIPGYLTLPVGREAQNLPLIVMPHGGPHQRSTKDFHYRAQFLANRGYAVLQPNFRGSSGFGRAFLAAGVKQWGGLMQDDVTDGTRWLIEEGIADPERICIMGASYGGYAALAGAALTPGLYRCAISINGVADLVSMIANSEKYVGGRQWNDSVGIEGEKLKSVSPRHLVDRIEIPILLIAARNDLTVNFKQSRSMHKTLRKAGVKSEFVELKEGGHGLMTGASRLKSLSAIESFLAKHLGPTD